MTNSNKNISIVTAMGFITILILLGLQQQQPQQQAAYGQAGDRGIEVLTSVPAQVAADGTFQNTDDGIRLKVPNGWGIKDVDNLDSANLAGESILGFGLLATVCNEHTPGLGGTTECDVTPDSMEVNIGRIQDLDQLPEVQNLILSQNKTLTVQDLVIIYQENVLEFVDQYDDLRVVNTIPRQVNVTNAEGTTTTQSTTAEGVIVKWQFTSIAGPVNMYSQLVFSPDKNTAYMVGIQGHLASEMPTIPTEVAQIFDSFELVI